MKLIGVKKCTKCNTPYPATEEFFYQQKKKDGSYTLQSWCKECSRKRSKEYGNAHKEQRKKNRRKWYVENKEHDNFKSKQWHKNHPERKKEIQINWQRKNPDKCKEYNENRQHKNHDITDEQWEKCKVFFSYQCAYCGMTLEEHKKVVGTDFHKEHIDDDGSNKIDNCIPSCKSCNSQKWIYDLNDWYTPGNPKFSIERLNKIIEWIEIQSL